jgi:hypothetical protein
VPTAPGENGFWIVRLDNCAVRERATASASESANSRHGLVGGLPTVAAVLSPDLRTRMVRLKASSGRLHPFHAYHRHMISALHPWLSFWLLAKAPNGLAPHQRQP